MLRIFKSLKPKIMAKLSKSNFTFRPSGHGHYRVEYHLRSGKKYSATIDDMELIDNTRNVENPTQQSLKTLATTVRWLAGKN